MKRYINFFLFFSIVAIAVVPYINSLHNPFIWDEEVIIVRNPIIHNARYLPELLKTSIFGGSLKSGGYYRPVYMLFFMLDYRLWKLNPIGYHIFSIVFHALNVLILYFIMRRIGSARKIAWLASLLFALFPVNCEAVTVIAARVEIIMGLFSLLCILTFLKGVSGSRGWFFATAILFVLAVFTKESALALPFIILAFSLIFLKWQERKRALFVFLILSILIISYCLVRILFVGNPFKATLSLINEASFMERLYTLPKILLTYMKLIIFPVVLKSEYHFVVHTARDVYVWLGLPLLAAFLIIAHRFLRPRKHVLFFSCWFLIGLSPYYNLIIPLHATLMEHWAYFPSMGFAALLAIALFGISEKIGSRPLRCIIALSLISLMSFYAGRIMVRNREWGDPFTLYKNDSAREPDSFLLHCNLGVEYFRRGMMKDAKKEFIESIDTSPGNGYDMAYNNLGVIYARQGDISTAVSCYKKSIALNDCSLGYENLGTLYNNLGMYKDAILLLERGTELYPLNIEMQYQLGVAYYRNGQLEAAKQVFEIVESIQSNYSKTKLFLGKIRDL